MSKRQFKSQASSSRVVPSFGNAFGSSASTTFGGASSVLSYLAEQPDLASINDPNIVVNFKNLSKKDATTKGKALDDMLSQLNGLVSSGGAVDDGILAAWCRIYPRLTIDLSRKVRQVAHSFQGEIFAACGKRTIKYMPSTSGPWLAGLYDGDRSVKMAASAAFKTVFPTTEKQKNVTKVFQEPILEFCRDTILNETPKTLSDERSTTADDSEAKYARVIASTILLVDHLIRTLPDDERQKYLSLYEEIVVSKKTWEFVLSKDSAVRKSILRLARTCLDQQRYLLSASIDFSGDAILSKKAIQRQAGSGLEYSELLRDMTAIYPMIWSQSSNLKSNALTRFLSLAEAGSQGAPSKHWYNLAEIFSLIPAEMIPSDIDTSREILTAVHKGINRRDEPRNNAEYAWGCYFNIARRLWHRLDAENDKQDLASERLMPMVKEYLFPSAETSQWAISGSQSVEILSSYLQDSILYTQAMQKLPIMAEKLVEDIQVSLPEQSKDYELSQNSVSAEGGRWFALQGRILSRNKTVPYEKSLWDCTEDIIRGAVHVLKARNGKPFGAAGVMKAAIESLGTLIDEHEQLSAYLNGFITKDLPGLLLSPSSQSLMYILYLHQNHPDFREAWVTALEKILAFEEPTLRLSTLKNFLTLHSSGDENASPSQNSALQALITDQIKLALEGETDWSFISAILRAKSNVISTLVAEKLIHDLVESFDSEDHRVFALEGVDMVITEKFSVFRDHLNPALGAKLLQNLSLHGPSYEGTSWGDIGNKIRRLTEEVMVEQDPRNSSEGSVLEVIQNSLADANANSLDVSTLVDLATKVLETSAASIPDNFIQLLPDQTMWSQKMHEILETPLPLSLAITDSLGGAVYLMTQPAKRNENSSLKFDRQGYSPAYRMAIYTFELFRRFGDKGTQGVMMPKNYLLLLLQSVQAIKDNIEIMDANSMFSAYQEFSDQDSDQSISRTQPQFISSMGDIKAHLEREESFQQMESTLFEKIRNNTPESFHAARLFVSHLSSWFEEGQRAQDSIADMEEKLKTLKKSGELLPLMAFSAAYRIPLAKSQVYTRLCNEAVADLTGRTLSKDPTGALKQLVLLNIIISKDDEDSVVSTIAKQRLIFFVKHIIPWLIDADSSEQIKSEIFKVLTTLLPRMSDVYGSHWADVCDCLLNCWIELSQAHQQASDTILPVLHSSLKVLKTLSSIATDESSNDDLKESWQDSRDQLIKALHVIFQQSGEESDEHNQPLSIVNELLSRQITRLPLKKVVHVEKFYSLMNAQSETVQKTAFDLLHQQIPNNQEQLSVDVALEKSIARLPDELLSLIIDAPTSESVVHRRFDGSIPLPVLGYLSSWILVFDHFQNSSDKVKTDYIAHLKEGDFLDGLLTFSFSLLGHARGKPVDVSKFHITKCPLDEGTEPVTEITWLLTHIYFLCLKNIPSLTRAWWMECRARQTVVSLESWTEKYVSPYVIADALEAVNKWAETQQDHSADDNLIIKVSQRAKEVIISKEVDDQMLAMALELPANFPLGQVLPRSVNRVAVDEKQWRSWQLITQGVINFSNSSLIEGIIAFRRNIMGALKGQTECAICYSIVAADKQLPTKKCGTCKNLFHGSCLYRWFKTSNSSSCPLCRNAFNYT